MKREAAQIAYPQFPYLLSHFPGYFLTDGKSSNSINLISCYCFFIMQGINAEPLTLLESFYFHKTTQNRSQKYKKTALKHTFSQYSSTQFLLNLALVDSFYYFFLRLGFMGNQPFSTRFF